jgi:hypothetical protein
MRDILRARGLDVYLNYVRPTFEQIKESIDLNHPIIMGLSTPVGGHLVLVIGYDNNNQQIIINDPFGRRAWWNERPNWWRGATNMPYTGSPKTVGSNIAYPFSELSPMINMTTFVRGSVSAAQGTVAYWQESFTNGNVSIQLGSSSQNVIMEDVHRVEFEPLVTVSTDVPDYDGTWESFTLSATDINGQSVESSSEPFTVEIVFDEEWLNGLQVVTGSISEGNSQSALPKTKVNVTVLRWDADTQTWVEIDSEVDFDADTINFQSSRFGEYTLAFTVNDLVYLPFVSK